MIKKNIKYATLRKFAESLLAVVIHVHRGLLDGDRLCNNVFAHTEALAGTHNLDQTKKQRLTFGTQEVRVILEQMMGFGPGDQTDDDPLSYDVAVQSSAIVNLVYYTAVRPGSLFPDENYSGHAKVGDAVLSCHLVGKETMTPLTAFVGVRRKPS